MDRDTFTKQRDISSNKSSVVQLLQCWHELKEREMTAKQHNQQLLQQFEEAQHTLKEMLSLTHTMKTIRMEFERYLEEPSPLWRQQLTEKTQPQQKKGMEEFLKSRLKAREMTKFLVDHPLPSRGSGSLWCQLTVEEASPEREVEQVVREEDERSPTPSSSREGESLNRSSNLSEELDIRPVRLPTENGEISRESSQRSREKGKRRGRSQRISSNQERPSSESRITSADVTDAVPVIQSSKNERSSEEDKTRTRSQRNAGLAVRSVTNGDDSGEESHSSSDVSEMENVGDQSPDNKSKSCTLLMPSGSSSSSEGINKDTETGGEMSDSSEESCIAEKDDEHEEEVQKENEEYDDENKENKTVEDKDDSVSVSHNTTDEEEETEPQDMEEESEEEDDQEETSIIQKKKNGKWGSVSSQDEEEEKGDGEGEVEEMEDNRESDKEEEGEGVEREEQRQDDAGNPEESDSDSIISPQNKPTQMHVIPEQEDESKTEASDNGSDESSDDIEHLLAPQEQPRNKEERDLKADEKPKGLNDNVKIFQVDTDTLPEMDHLSDSDHFFD
ncbi:protein starmaker-like isoform X2 [Antennarius striatus]|uniref:protein starmaker-like isoform X2 n=1 Tax=Antennarius striatus TaxID=241820 RepID=UPI0035B1F134